MGGTGLSREVGPGSQAWAGLAPRSPGYMPSLTLSVCLDPDSPEREIPGRGPSNKLISRTCLAQSSWGRWQIMGRGQRDQG